MKASMANPMNEKINLRLPVKISYSGLEAYLRKELVGKRFQKDEGKDFAEVLGISLESSKLEDFDLQADVDARMLSSIFKNRNVRVVVDIALDFQRNTQVVSVRDFRVDIKSRSWLVDNALEAVVNAFLYDRLKKRMQFDLRDLIKGKLSEINTKLESPQQATDGIAFSGFVEAFRLVDLFPGKKVLLAVVEVEARALIDIKEINF